MNRRGLWLVLGLFGGLFFVLFALLVVTSGAIGAESYRASSNAGIGVIEIKGPINDSKRELRWIRGFSEEPTIKAILVRIDSPGGAVAPSQEIFSELKKLSATKPVVASMGSVAASGGYYIALGANKIVANPGTITGSIGVIMQTVDASQLLALTKLDWQTYKSGEYKDMGSPLRQPTDNDKKLFAAMIKSVYEQFVRAIVESRKLEDAAVRAVADGRVLTGEQALETKLVDELGSFQGAVDRAAQLAAIKGKPELVYPPEDDGNGFIARVAREASRGAASALVPGIVEAMHLGTVATPKFLMPGGTL
ncbi:MAG: signal peptide peptidase SppA [Deltaproteobacteria bacterium]|nr:signal peptide peptidase SppA [Deltaproteobacteria bacterium]